MTFRAGEDCSSLHVDLDTYTSWSSYSRPALYTSAECLGPHSNAWMGPFRAVAVETYLSLDFFLVCNLDHERPTQAARNQWCLALLFLIAKSDRRRPRSVTEVSNPSPFRPRERMLSTSITTKRYPKGLWSVLQHSAPRDTHNNLTWTSWIPSQPRWRSVPAPGKQPRRRPS